MINKKTIAHVKSIFVAMNTLIIAVLLTIKNVKSKDSKDLLLTNRTLIIGGLATKSYDCPPVNADDEATCSGKITAVGTAITNIDTVKGAGVATAIDGFIDACGVTACKTGCQAIAKGKNIPDVDTDGALAAAFKTDGACVKASPVTTDPIGTDDCATVEANGETCSTKYQDVVTALTTTTEKPWNPSTIGDAIEAYVSACKTTKCQADCKKAISSVNIVGEYKGLKTNFEANCNPTPKTEDKSSQSKAAQVSISLILISLVLGTIQLIKS
jgi:hypothetical protein